MTAPQTELGNEIVRERRKNEEERVRRSGRKGKEDGRRTGRGKGWGERGRREEKRI